MERPAAEVGGALLRGPGDGAQHSPCPTKRRGTITSIHLYVIETKNPAHRDPLLDFLTANGIDAKCHYPIAIHQQEGYPWGKTARIAGPIPKSERNAACCVSLPMFPELTAEEVDYVIGKSWNGTGRRGERFSPARPNTPPMLVSL